MEVLYAFMGRLDRRLLWNIFNPWRSPAKRLVLKIAASRPFGRQWSRSRRLHHLPRLFLVLFLYAALFTFAHRARCAAAIRFRPAAEIVLFGFGA